MDSQSEDSESEASEELEEEQDDLDITEGLNQNISSLKCHTKEDPKRRADPGNKTVTQLENSETTTWDLPVMPAPDAGKTTETRE